MGMPLAPDEDHDDPNVYSICRICGEVNTSQTTLCGDCWTKMKEESTDAD